LRKRLERNFGESVVCRFVDVDGPELANYPSIAERVQRGKAALPIVAIDGKVRYSGIFSPTFIQRDVREILGGDPRAADGTDRRTLPSRQGRARTAEWVSTTVSGRPHFSTSVHRHKR